MKKLIIVLIAISLSSLTFAQPWTVNPAEYEFSMNIIGEVSIAGEIADNESNYVGAFIGDVCVGVCSPIEVNEEFSLFYLTVYSNQSSGDNIEFKFVDESDVETLISNTIEFSSDAVVGGSSNPFLWMDVELYSSTDFLSFSFTEEFSPAVIDTESKTIDVVVIYSSDLTSLIPTFEIAPEAVAKISDVEQESAVTSNNYSEPVEYVVEGIDGISATWTINVSLDVTEVDETISETISVYPNPASDYIQVETNDLNIDKIQILDVHGKVVIRKNLYNTMEKVDISSLKTGVYFVRFFKDKAFRHYKFFKQ